jgi:hypothetical protein
MMVVQRLLRVNGQSTDRKQLRSAISIVSRSHPIKSLEATCVATLEGQTDRVQSISFHPSLPILVTNHCFQTLGEQYFGNCVTFHPTAAILASTSSEDKTVKLWRMSWDASATCVADLETKHKSLVAHDKVVFHPSQLFMASYGMGNTATVFRLNSDYEGASCIATLPYSEQICSLAFHSTAPILATGHIRGTVKLWRISSENSALTCIATLDAHSMFTMFIEFHQTLPLLATGSLNGNTKLWRLNSDCTAVNCVETLEEHKPASITFHPSAPLLAVCSFHNGTKFWRINSENSGASCIGTLADSELVSFVAFHQTLPLLATANDDGKVRLWR